MDIPLPDDDPPINENLDDSLADIPVPEDTNRYSPSLPIEDDPPDFKNDLSTISLPSDTQKLPVPPTVSVLGKEAAKKRLLAFSQAKQSFISQKRKPSIQAVIEGNVLKDNDAKSIQPKKKKKGVLDKARDTISEIEELKRRENEVMETMQVLFPMWSNLDKKTTPVTSLIIQDGIVERSDRIESVVEKLLSKKSKHERKEQERMERLEERKRKRERREKEIRRLMPKSWAEFNKSGFKAYHFRRQKFRLEKLSEGMKPKERTRSHEHEREGSKRFNLLDTPMVLKKPLVVSGVNNEDIEFPSWAVRYTNTWPPISYCVNQKYDTKRYISRKEMFSTLPDNIYAIIKKFLSPSCLNKFNEENPESNRSWWKRDLFLIPKSPGNNLVEQRNNIQRNDHAEDIFEANFPVSDAKFNELSDYSKVNKNEEFDKNSSKSLSDIPSSEEANSDVEKSYSSELSEIEAENKASSAGKEESKNEENLASEYEQFIKTIGPNTDNKESSETTGRADEIWLEVSEEKEIFSESSSVTTKKKLEVEDQKKLKDKKRQKHKRKKVKKKAKKRSHSSDSSSSETSSSSSRSSSSSSDSSSTTSTSSSSSSSGSSSSSSSSSSASTSSSNDSSSESSTSTSSSGSTTSSDSQSFEGKTKKKLKKKHLSKKKIISSGKNKNKKMVKVENEDEKAFMKKKKKRKEDLVKEDNEKSDNEAEVCDLKNLTGSPQKPLTEVVEGEGESLTSKGEIGDPSVIIGEEKVNQDEMYEPRDSSPQSRTSDEGGSSLSNSSLKSITSEPVLSNEQKDTNNSLHWNSGEESVSNLPMDQDIHENDSAKPPEGKRHFNIDMFQESHNCTPDISSARESPSENGIENLSHRDFKGESKEENDNTNSRVLPQSGEESALKSLERYSPTAEDEDEEEYEDFLTNNTSGGGSTLDDASQLVSFGVNSASEEARMLDIPLPPPIEAPSEAPTSFRNILQLPSSPNQQPHQLDIKKKNFVLIGKSPVARLTFGKQVMKLKPISIFSTEDSDSEADKTPFPLSTASETNDASLPSLSGAVETKDDNYTQESVNSSQITNEIINNQVSVPDIEASNVDAKSANAVLDSSSPQSKKSRWDQEASKSEERDCIGDVAERSLLINPVAEKTDNSERKVSGYQSVVSVPEFLEKVKGKARKEDSRSPVANDKKRRRERSHSSERDRRRRERVWSPRDRGRFSRDRRRDFRKRSRSKERRSRRDSPHREYSPGWRKSSPQTKLSRRSPSQEGEQRKMFEKSLRTENIIINHDLPNEPSTTFDSSWNKSELNLNEVKDSYNSSPKKKESLSDWDSPERKYSPSSRKESPKRKKSPVSRDSPFRSPRRKESPLRKRTPENRKESPNRRYSPRRSPLPWKRSSPDRRRSPYSPRRSSPSRRRVSPDRKRPGSPYRRRSSLSPERKYSGRYMRKSPIKHQSYSNSPSREEKWKWEEDKEPEKRGGVEGERFPKWDWDGEAPQADAASDYQTSLADSTISDSELVKEPPSPKRMSLDERLKIELGHTNTNIEPEQRQNIPAFHSFYYPPPTVADPVGYFPHQQYNVNPQPPPRLQPDWNPSLHPPQLPNKLVQVGNVLQVVPTEIPVEPVFSAPPPKMVRNVEVLQPKVLQVGNVLQVVPSQEPPPPPPPPQSVPLQFNTNITPPSPVAAPIQKMTAPPSQPAPPVSIISLPFPPGSPNVFMKLEEKERRKKEKELRKEKKEQKVARRMLRKAMLKKRLAKANEPDNEANTCAPEAVENESGELDTSKAAVVLPSPDKGILIGLKDTIVLTSTKKKSVSFADGIKPGEGTSPSGGEEHPLSPPPLIRKPVKKRKKRKVKVRIIRIDSNSKEEESEEDELSPPPPPPGTPPPEAYIEYTASGRYLYPVSTSQPFSGNQDGGTVFPPLPAVTASPAAVVQFTTPPLPQQR